MKYQYIIALYVCFIAFPTQADDRWLMSITGGSGSANDPNSQTNSIDIESSNITQITFNLYDKQNRDGANLYYEVFLSHNDIIGTISSNTAALYNTSINAYHVQIGGAYEWADNPIFRPYFSITLGVSYYQPANTGSDMFPSGTVGIGARIWVSSTFAFNLEARVIGTALDNSTGIFCENNDCGVGVSSKLWTQQQISAGITWAF